MPKGEITNGTVYWAHVSGELMVAPDSRVDPAKLDGFRGWRRIQCRTTAEVEQFSRRMAAQEFTKFKNVKVEEHLRHMKKREELKANCRLRLAKGCISAEDERLTRETLKSLERKDAVLMDLITKEPDLSRAHLVIEEKEESTAVHKFSDKRKGLRDDELSLIGSVL